MATASRKITRLVLNDLVTGPCISRLADAWSEQWLTAGGARTRAPARRPGGRVSLEGGLDGGDETADP